MILWIAAAGGVLGAAGWYLWDQERRRVTTLRERLENASMALEGLETSFARFAPQAVVDRIAASGVPSAPEKKDVTVLFADIVSFTELAEQLAPDTLVRILNGYFERMSRMITEHRGHVSKFIGDGILALFGALEGNPWQVNDAVQAALAMRAELEHYNHELEAAGLPRLRFGIGIHCGAAIAGVVGSHELVEFTVIGNTVNLASRVEHLTRVHGVDILITRAVQERLAPHFRLRELPAVSVRGVSEPVVTYAVEAATG